MNVKHIEELAVKCMRKDLDLWEELGIIAARSSDPERTTVETERLIYEPRIRVWFRDNGFMELEPAEIKAVVKYLTSESFYVLCKILEEMYCGENGPISNPKRQM